MHEQRSESQRTLLSGIKPDGTGACKFKCAYCYAAEPTYKPTFSTHTSSTIETLELNSDRFDTIVPSCDTEFLQDPKNALRSLEDLAKLGKDITFPTKMLIGQRMITELQKIQQILNANGNILSVMVSIPLLDRAKEIEINTPSPNRRSAQVKTLSEAGLYPYIAIRPLLPPNFISEDEVKRIVHMTVGYSEGYTTGPYWFKTDTLGLLNDPTLPITKKVVDWMDDPEEWFYYYDQEREQTIVDLIGREGGTHIRKTPELMRKIKSANPTTNF